MTIETRPLFYMVNAVTSDNNLLNFVEPGNPPGTELTAELLVGSRSMTNLMTEVARALNDAGQETYTVTFDRDTRIVTISATDTFELLVSSGSNVGNDIFSILGFTGADRTGASTYDGDTAMGFTYTPQLIPQRFLSFDDNLQGVQSSVNESASGQIEVVTFGDRRFMEMEITNITNRPQGKGAPIENNQSALSQVRAFLEFAVTKSEFEFMIDRTDKATFETVLLERTRASRDGTGFRLRELINRGLNGFFTTELLTFRQLE